MRAAFCAYLLALAAAHGAAHLACRACSIAHPTFGAHQFVSIVTFAAFALVGASEWLALPDDVSAEARVHGFELPASVQLAHAMLAFQIYECITALAEPTGRLMGPSYIMFFHHLSAACVAAALVRFGFGQYYTPFFFGAVEISSVPLIIMDTFKARAARPPPAARAHPRRTANAITWRMLQAYAGARARFPLANEVSQWSFAALFLPLRAIYFVKVSLCFWVDAYAFLGGSATRTLRRCGPRRSAPCCVRACPPAHRSHVGAIAPVRRCVQAFLAFNVVFVGLNLNWAAQIVATALAKTRKDGLASRLVVEELATSARKQK